ncbi:MAG: hypothetical protein IE926_09840 [Micrococcales bacterium]|nr:hypothetical protein [Micrococcales bacterium]
MLPLLAALVVMVAAMWCGAGEHACARLLDGGRPASEAERCLLAPAVTAACRAGVGPPLVEVLVQPRSPRLVAAATGRRTVLVPGGLLQAVQDGRIEQEEAAGSLVSAAALVRSGLRRDRGPLQLWCLPWAAISVVLRGVGGGLGALPLVHLVWHGRALVAGVVLVQWLLADHPWGAALLVMACGVSYLAPVADRAHQRRLEAVGDRAVVDAGLGESYARLLLATADRVDPQRRTRLSGQNLTARVELAPVLTLRR